MHQELRAAGLPTSTKRVARLMREAGLAARPKTRRRVVTTDATHGDPIAPNRLARQFDVHGVALNQLWVGDITYIPTRDGVLPLSTVLDLGSRRCVGWAMRDTMEADLVTSALEMAHGAGRIYGMLASMRGKGDCSDDAVAESFFATLEFDPVMMHDWPTRAEARRASFRDLETWFNRKRRHSTLGYVSPAEYEAQFPKAA